MPQAKPKSDVAVYKYEGPQRTKKKKARPIEGRQVQDAYFAKALEKREPSPLEKVWQNILARFPEDLRRNVTDACRSVSRVFQPKEETPKP